MTDQPSMPSLLSPKMPPRWPSDKWLGVVAVLALGVVALSTALTVRSVQRQFQSLDRQRQEVVYSRELLDSLARFRDQVLEGVAVLHIYGESRIPLFLSGYQQMRNNVPELLKDLRQHATKTEDLDKERQLEQLCNEVLSGTDALAAQLQRLNKPVAPDDVLLTGPISKSTTLRLYVNEWRQQHSDHIIDGNRRASGELNATQQFAVGAVLTGATLIALLAGVALRMLKRRAQLAQELHTSSQLWHGTLSNLDQGVGVYSMNRRLMYWNQRYAEIHDVPNESLYVGISFEQVIRRSAGLKGVSVEDAIAEAGQVADVVRGGGTLEVHQQNVHDRALHITARSMTDDYYLVTLTDVTALRRSELAAVDQSTRLAAIMDNVADAIITINPSGSIESWSAGAERIFGYRKEQILRRNVNVLMPEPYCGRHDQYLRNLLDGRGGNAMGRRREFTAVHCDGHVFPIDLVVSEMHIGDKRLFVGIVRDITERRAVEQMKSEFISTVSHELRTPLTSIAGSLALLSDNPQQELSAKTLRLINIAHKNSERLTRLINDILDLEKSESGRLTLNLKPLSLRWAVEQAIDANRAYAAAYQVDYLMTGSDAGQMVSADSDRIMQVLTNFMSNAAKFSPPRTQVEIHIEAMAGRIRVEVRDHGSGIPPEFRGRVFSRFAQADGSDSRVKEGTGLGLAIAKSLIELHGGKIGFDTTASGTTFWFELKTLPDAVLSDSAMSVESLRAARILICEDDPDAAQYLGALLERRGCTVHLAGSAAETRHALDSIEVDLLLVDVHLPDEDGLSLIASLRSNERTADLPIIVVSAMDQDAAQPLAIAALEIDDWIDKPIDIRRLQLSMQRVLPASGQRPLVLHVEDDESIITLVNMTLSQDVDIIAAHTLEQARQALQRQAFDLIVLDINLPDGSGLDLLSELRSNGVTTPVVLFSAQQASHEVTALVQAALLKSHNSLERLLSSVRILTRRADVTVSE